MEDLEPQELTTEEFTALLDERARTAFDMPFEEFAERVRNGEIDAESPEAAGLALFVVERTS
jgi:hypothetical protein